MRGLPWATATSSCSIIPAMPHGPTAPSIAYPCARRDSRGTLELIEGVLVEGKVVDSVSGDPVVGISVGMYGPARPHSGAAILGATTDEKGRYRFRLPPGETQFYLASAEKAATIQEIVIPADKKSFTVPTLVARTRPRTKLPAATK